MFARGAQGEMRRLFLSCTHLSLRSKPSNVAVDASGEKQNECKNRRGLYAQGCEGTRKRCNTEAGLREAAVS